MDFLCPNEFDELDTPGGGMGFDSRDPEGRNVSFASGVKDHAEGVASVADRSGRSRISI